MEYPCFIAHSTNDAEFAQQLQARMQQKHFHVWCMPEDMNDSQKNLPHIDEAIRVHDKLLLVLSENSIQSTWVKREIRKARQLELETRRFSLFPISLIPLNRLLCWECIDSETGEDLATEVLAYHIPDFSNWKDPDAFEDNFKKLTDALRASEPDPAESRLSSPKS
jgi:hypothetical protein